MLLPSLFTFWSPGPLGQLLVAFVGSWCAFTCGQTFSWAGPAMLAIRSGGAGFSLTSEEESWMVTVAFIGNVLSPIPAGFIMDLIGRKRIVHCGSLLALAAWAIIYFCRAAAPLYVARVLLGVWAGVVYTAVPVLVGEVVSPELRGSMGTMFGILLYLGCMYESLLGMYVSYDVLALASLAPPFFLLVTLFLLPESPYYHLMKGNREEASLSLKWLRGACDNDYLDDVEDSVKEQLENRGSFIDLLKVRPYRKAFIIAEALGFIQRMSGLTMLMSYASVFFPPTFISPKQSVTVLNAVWTLGSFGSFFIMDKFGRRTFFSISTLGSGLTMLGVSVWYYLRDFTDVSTETTNWFPLLILLVNGVFYSLGLVSIPTLVQGELFPVNIKGKASALACMTMATSSAISTKIYQPLTDYAGVYTNFLLCAAACAIGALFSHFYLVETRGKSLEEIQEILSEKKRKRRKKKETQMPEVIERYTSQ